MVLNVRFRCVSCLKSNISVLIVQPLRLDIKRQLSARSDRVKSADIHPTEPWILLALYSGRVNIWNLETQTSIRSFEVSEMPVRAGKFVQRKNWIITGSVTRI